MTGLQASRRSGLQAATGRGLKPAPTITPDTTPHARPDIPGGCPICHISLAGRYQNQAPSDRRSRVSIHSRQLCREIRTDPAGHGARDRFNPLPAVMPGDTCPVRRNPTTARCFNPLPAVMPGDTWRDAPAFQIHEVSIHSRQLCREIPIISSAVGALPSSGFNPLPAVMPGDTNWYTAERTKQAMFQSTPGSYAGRYFFTPKPTTPTKKFQSTPGSYAGRYAANWPRSRPR